MIAVSPAPSIATRNVADLAFMSLFQSDSDTLFKEVRLAYIFYGEMQPVTNLVKIQAIVGPKIFTSHSRRPTVATYNVAHNVGSASTSDLRRH